MIIGVTATRRGLTDRQLRELASWIRHPSVSMVHHGDCVGGDRIAHLLAVEARKRVVVHPPDVSRYRAFCHGDATTRALIEIRNPKPYLERDRDIVDEIELLIALPFTPNEQLRSGTWTTVRYARRIGRRVALFLP